MDGRLDHVRWRHTFFQGRKRIEEILRIICESLTRHTVPTHCKEGSLQEARRLLVLEDDITKICQNALLVRAGFFTRACPVAIFLLV